MLQLLTFKSIYKERIWGSRNLEKLGKKLPGDAPIGEAWELADLPEDKSVVDIGPAAGKNIAQLVQEWKTDLLGNASLDGGQFPLLIKLLDAADTLSVQVHPDYESEKKMGGNVRAKYESWYVMDAKPDGFLYIGLKPGTSLHQVRQAVEKGNLEDILIKIPVKKGDFFYLPGGTIHAIGKGLVIAEIQTPSDTTFRLYDWKRVDAKTGKPRQLHIEESLQCIRPDQNYVAPKYQPGQKAVELCCAPTFCITKLLTDPAESMTLKTGQPLGWVMIEGAGSMTDGNVTVDLKPGKTVLIPAGLKKVRADFTSQSTVLEVKLIK